MIAREKPDYQKLHLLQTKKASPIIFTPLSSITPIFTPLFEQHHAYFMRLRYWHHYMVISYSEPISMTDDFGAHHTAHHTRSPPAGEG